MGYKTLELTLISARDLKNVNLIGKMDVYVVVSLSGDPRTKQKTPVHQDGGSSPYWNHTLRFTVDEDTAGWSVVFQLKHEHTFGRDKDVGEVRVPVKDLLSNKDSQIATYQVRRPSGKTKGELKFSYKATDAVLQPKAAPQASSSSSAAYPYPPQSAYPAPPQTAYPPQSANPPPPQTAYPPQSAYPPPPQTAYPPQSTYPPPPAAGYPYGGYLAPQQQPGYGYGYPQQITQKPMRNGGFGMGLGAGLIGGALGGLLIEDMVSDSYDAGYGDAGYDDADFDMGF